jgi:hypothetical protein
MVRIPVSTTAMSTSGLNGRSMRPVTGGSLPHFASTAEAASTTCLFVTTKPSAVTTNPDPKLAVWAPFSAMIVPTNASRDSQEALQESHLGVGRNPLGARGASACGDSENSPSGQSGGLPWGSCAT